MGSRRKLYRRYGWLWLSFSQSIPYFGQQRRFVTIVACALGLAYIMGVSR